VTDELIEIVQYSGVLSVGQPELLLLLFCRYQGEYGVTTTSAELAFTESVLSGICIYYGNTAKSQGKMPRTWCNILYLTYNWLFCHTVTKARAIANPRRMRTKNWLEMGTWQEMRPRRRPCSKNRRAVSALYWSPGSELLLLLLLFAVIHVAVTGYQLQGFRRLGSIGLSSWIKLNHMSTTNLFQFVPLSDLFYLTCRT
jgi:cytochrome b subunit of formate dehydrogenase